MAKTKELKEKIKEAEQNQQPAFPWKEKPLVSIIIPVIIANEQFLQMTTKCLQSIAITTKDMEGQVEIIVVDNASPLPAYFRTDVHIKNPVNLGYGPAINQGIKLSRGKYVVPMNNDVFVQEGWLQPLVDALEEDENIGVIRPKAVNAGGYGKEKRKFGEGNIQIGTKDYHGFCYVMPRKVIDEIGMFDEQFAPAYCEDVDMWVRLDKAGYKMAKHNGSHIEHLGGVTGPIANIGDSMQKNRVKFKKKWGFDVFSEKWYSDYKALLEKFGEV